jgi:myo-inositol-1(or 4)-monophosphatase
VDDFSLAEELVRDAGALASSMLNDGLETRYKTSVSDVVSAADQAAEELVVGRLRTLRPDDGLVGEEGSMSPGDGRTWYVDPVDGTYNFLSGVPYWCSAVGLVDGTGPVVGAVYYPAVDELWIGGPGRRTTLNGVLLTALADQPLAQVSIATYLHPRHLGDRERVSAWQSAIGRAATVRMLGSASVDLAGVAGGRLGVFLQANLKPWDWFPGAALVLGAGGVAETLQVGAISWQIAGNRQAVEDTKTALRQSAARTR